MQDAPTQVATRPLFGGAMSIDLPPAFQDISVFRQVPDNQEVFADMNDRSFVIELLEMPAGFPDEVTLDYHFEQLASDNEAKEFAILEREVVPDTHKPDLSDVKVLTAVGSQTIAKFNESEKSADAYNTVVIFIAVVRIPKHMTDVIITLNCPVKIGSGSSSAVMVEHVATNLTEVRDTFQHIVRSFKVHDWSLLSSQ